MKRRVLAGSQPEYLLGHDIFHYVSRHFNPLDLLMCSMVCKTWLAYVDGDACRNRWWEIYRVGVKGRFILKRYQRGEFGRREFLEYMIVLPPQPTAAWFLGDAITHDQKITLIGGELSKRIKRGQCMVAFPKTWDPNGDRILFSIIQPFQIYVEGHPDISLHSSEVHEWFIPHDDELERAAMSILLFPYLYWLLTGSLIEQ